VAATGVLPLPKAIDRAINAKGFIVVHRAGPIVVPFVFPMPPQSYDWDAKARGQVHQTADDNWLDDFSGPRAVLPRVNVRGTWGYPRRLGGIGLPMTGASHTKAFELIWETFNALDRQVKANMRAVQEFYDLTRLHAWRVWIDRVRFRRSHESPLTILYDISLLRLEDYLSPVGGLIPAAVTVFGAAALGARF